MKGDARHSGIPIPEERSAHGAREGGFVGDVSTVRR